MQTIFIVTGLVLNNVLLNTFFKNSGDWVFGSRGCICSNGRAIDGEDFNGKGAGRCCISSSSSLRADSSESLILAKISSILLRSIPTDLSNYKGGVKSS